MAAATVSKPDKSFILAAGPLMIEFVHLEEPADGETYASKLASPSWATLHPAGDAGGTFDGSASVSGRTVTIHDPKASLNHLLMVFGNGLV